MPRVEVAEKFEKLEVPKSIQEVVGKATESVEHMVEAVGKGESIQPFVEALTGYLEGLAHESIDQLVELATWIDKEFGALAGEVGAEIKELLTEVLGGVRELVARGEAYLNEHPEMAKLLGAGISVAFTLLSPVPLEVADPLAKGFLARLA